MPTRPQQPATPPGEAAAPTPPVPVTPPYHPFPPRETPPDLSEDLGIEVEPEGGSDLGSRPVGVSDPSHAPGATHAAARGEIGKTCPYCRFPVKPGEQAVTCPACNLPHHADCWRENQGCTTYGCRGGASVVGPAAAMRGPAVHSTLSPTGGVAPSVEYLQTNELAARANNALILAIVGLLCCAPLGVVGLFMGIAVLADVNRLRSRAADARGKAIAAVVLGVVGIVGWVIYFVVLMANRQ